VRFAPAGGQAQGVRTFLDRRQALQTEKDANRAGTIRSSGLPLNARQMLKARQSRTVATRPQTKALKTRGWRPIDRPMRSALLIRIA
jgi:hypothetical protein